MNGATIAPSQSAPEAHLLGHDHQFFEFNVSGMRDYLDSIKDTQPKLYAEISPELERLETKRTQARLFALGSIAVGGALGAFYIQKARNGRISGSDDPFSDSFMARYEGPSGTLMIVSGIAVGALGYYLLNPDRKDLIKFINKHNSAIPDRPIRLQLGLAPAPRGGMLAGLQLQF
jgi:hypothetical protein